MGDQPGDGHEPGPERLPAFNRLGIAMARYHGLVVAVWVVILVGSALLVPRFHSSVTGPPLDVLGSDSYRAQEIIATRFDQPFAEQDLVVFESETLVATDDEFRAVINTALDRVEEFPGVVSVVSPFDPRAGGLVSEGGNVATAVVGLSGSNADRQALSPRLTEAAASAATDEVRVYVTGRSPLIAELVDQQEEDLSRAERLGLPLALLILLIASGTVVAASLPLLLAMAGVIVTFGMLGAVSTFTEFNLFVPNIATMIGLGVGIDYALFIVNRYREELARGADPRRAVATTTATAGRTVFFSGLTVLLSLAGLLLVNARIFQELALGAMSAVLIMALGALTLVPALLAWLGPRVNALRLPGRSQQSVSFGGERFWERWARTIMQRPGVWAAGAIVILLLLAAPVTRLNLALDTGTSDIGQQSAGLGREILEREFNEGRISPLEVVYVSQDGPLDDADLETIARLSELLANDYAAVSVTSVTTLLDRFVGNHSVETLELAATFPQVVEGSGDLINLASGSDVAVIRAVPRWSPDSPGPLELVQRVRDTMVPNVLESQGVDAEVVVGGLSAQIVDITAESLRKLPVVIGLVVMLSFVLLALVFRSIVIPIKAILMNVLSIAAAYGLLVVVFQEGAGAKVFDFQRTGATQVYLPLLTFAVLFGLSMDYEVFLLGRIKEEWELTRNNQSAVVRGLQRTGAVITTAAAIMVTVFAAFTFARLTEVKTLGFSLAAAVLIDATLIRIILVPAAMQLMGEWNWWFPAWL
ncbi:MAG: MMPL family transporter, partial [Chloroflexi bacterium]|nr:MMPL family transporter [Chloroflexota bacterium]